MSSPLACADRPCTALLLRRCLTQSSHSILLFTADVRMGADSRKIKIGLPEVLVLLERCLPPSHDTTTTTPLA